MSQFGADDILNGQTEGPMETDYVPVPEGEFRAVIDKVDVRLVGEGKDKPVLDVMWKIDDPAVAAQMGIENPTVRQTIFLDIADGGRGLALGKGKNVQLGRLREAVGQNGPSPWAPGQLVGCVATVRTAQREYEGRTFTDVKAVAAA